MNTAGSVPIRRRTLLAAGPLAVGAAVLGTSLAGATAASAAPAAGTTVTGFPHLDLGRKGGVVATDGARTTVFKAVASDSGPGDASIDVGPALGGQQRIEGFGPALTHSAASLLLGMGAATRHRLLVEMFAPSGGHHLNALRIPLGTSDFTTKKADGQPDYYTFADRRGPAADPLGHFSIRRDEQTILPVLREIVRIAPHLTVVLSPWSAPAWMKTSGSLIGGSLVDTAQVRELYADYLARAVQAYQRAVPGLRITAVTVQNEPLHDTAAYPCMGMTPEIQIDVITRLHRHLRARRLGTGAWVYDHNWDHPEYPIQVLDGLARRGLPADGTAFHCYGGDAATAGDAVHAAHPDQRIWVTEQSGTRDLSKSYDANFSDGIWWMSHTLFLPALSHHHRGVILFNLVLDEDGGPGPSTFTNGTGLVQLDTTTGTLRPNSEFYVMTHFSRFIPAGSPKLSVTTSEPGSDTLQAVAADAGPATVVVVHNNKPQRRVGVRAGGRTLTATLPGWSLATYVMPHS